MNLNKNETVYLANYKPPHFLIPKVSLILDIFEDKTLVSSSLDISLNPQCTSESEKGLFLNGEELELKSIKLNGERLLDTDYEMTPLGLLIYPQTLKGQKKFKLEIENIIYPHKNEKLEGFYQSGDILCTQCEPEGFRRITYFVDRPDNMAFFSCELRGDKTRFPFLLANGNCLRKGELSNGRHFAIWEDPFKKPSYLFACVAGDLEKVSDSFKTSSGREVVLEIFVDKGNGYKTGHAMASLKKAMSWDEKVFKREYDLDIYMIVAVESFNFGAMENKGLNIFNSYYVLADHQSATDSDLAGVESVVAHEYFHNWTGNRITCRDWFQLTLKEGLTVFRDQEFSADMTSRSLKGVQDVRRLIEAQFPEDAGPMSHPIKPTQYQEINNFYTSTVYEKGAEVIRMLETLLGHDLFHQGIQKYFELYDGQAVTTEDFIHALEVASKRDLSQFKHWYSTSGTPSLNLTESYDETDHALTLSVEQKIPIQKKGENSFLPLLIPLKMSFWSSAGKKLKPDFVWEINELKQHVIIQNIMEKPIVAYNVGFLAPVHINAKRTINDEQCLLKYESDGIIKYQSAERLYLRCLSEMIEKISQGQSILQENFELPHYLYDSLNHLLTNSQDDLEFLSLLFELPVDSHIYQIQKVVLVEATDEALKILKKSIAMAFKTIWPQIFSKLTQNHLALTEGQAKVGVRAWLKKVAEMLVLSDPQEATLVFELFKSATNMTLEFGMLEVLVKHSTSYKDEALKRFYQKWENSPLVMMKWFALQASTVSPQTMIEDLAKLTSHSRYRSKVPNDIRAVWSSFARNANLSFHHRDGRGYQAMIEEILRVDAFNAAMAARLVSSFALYSKLDKERKTMLSNFLKKMSQQKLSKDVSEILETYLSQG